MQEANSKQAQILSWHLHNDDTSFFQKPITQNAFIVFLPCLRYQLIYCYNIHWFMKSQNAIKICLSRIECGFCDHDIKCNMKHAIKRATIKLFWMQLCSTSLNDFEGGESEWDAIEQVFCTAWALCDLKSGWCGNRKIEFCNGEEREKKNGMEKELENKI